MSERPVNVVRESPGYYAIIPASVRYDDRLKPNAKLLYGEITALCGAEGHCWAGNEYFAGLYSVDSATISRWISQLIDCGYIHTEVLKSEGNKRKIFIENMSPTLLTKKSIAIDKKVKTLLTKKSIAIDEKVKSNNRMNITINNTLNREEKALDFLMQNFPSRYESFEMKFKSRLVDFQAFVDDFNCKVIEEQKEWDANILFARLERLANNWVRNAKNTSAGFGSAPTSHNNAAPAYMSKSLK